ncbi:MAG: TonB-dependent receptor [Planctomycetota bacterium]
MPALAPLLLVLSQDVPRETLVTAPREQRPATDSPGRVVALDAEDLVRTGERSLPRAISKAAGIGVWAQETNLGGGSPMLRGLIGEKVLIVVDGVRLNDSTTRLGPNQSLNTIDPAIVEQVEVVRGPASVLYGSDAVGGAILIRTKRRDPDSVTLRGEINAFEATVDLHLESATEGGRASLGASGSMEQDAWLLIGSGARWNELRTGDGVVEFTGYDTGALFGSFVHDFDDERSLRLTGRVHRDFHVPRTDRLIQGYGQTQPSNEEFDFVLQDNSALTLAYTDEGEHALCDRMQARTFLRYYEEWRDIRATGSSTLRDERDTVVGYGVGVDWMKALSEENLLTYGLDFERDDVIESERTNINTGTGVATDGVPTFAPNSHYASAGVFVRDEIASFAPFDVTLGARYSFFDFSFNEFSSGPGGGPEESGDFDAFTGSLAVARDVGEDWRVTGTVAQGFRAPHLDDLAKNGSIFGGTELANPDLDPEESLTGEIDLDYARAEWAGSLAMFYTDIYDFIGRRLIDVGDPGTTGDETYLRDNTGNLAIWGAELEVRRKLGSEDADFAVGAGIAWTEGRQYDDTIDPTTGDAPYDGVPARRIPPLHGKLSLLYEPAVVKRGIQWGELQLTVADEQDDLNPEDLADPRINPDGTAGWAVVDLDFGGSLGSLRSGSRWSLGFHNLLDREYRIHGSGFDAPGFNVVVELAWTF